MAIHFKVSLLHSLVIATGGEPDAWVWDKDDEPVRKKIQRPNMIQIFVKNLEGKTFDLQFNEDHLIEKFRQLVSNASGTPTDQIRLLYAGTTLEDGVGMFRYQIPTGSTVHLVQRLRGC